MFQWEEVIASVLADRLVLRGGLRITGLSNFEVTLTDSFAKWLVAKALLKWVQERRQKRSYR